MATLPNKGMSDEQKPARARALFNWIRMRLAHTAINVLLYEIELEIIIRLKKRVVSLCDMYIELLCTMM